MVLHNEIFTLDRSFVDNGNVFMILFFFPILRKMSVVIVWDTYLVLIIRAVLLPSYIQLVS